MPYKDKAREREVKRAYDRAHVGDERRLRAARKRHALLRAWLTDQKRKPCADCGRTFPPECMDFDHFGTDKYRTLSQLLHSSRAKMLAEIAKCDLVCANCHRIRTSARLRAKSA